MSSRFVSSGAIDTKTGDAVPVETPSSASNTTTTTTTNNNGTNKTEQWAEVQAQLEAERLQRQKAREEAAASSQTTGGGGPENRSLFDVLQANKAAKQAAFEEANKIKNQFRPLDDDEVEFLEDVKSRRREEEERLRRETEEGLRGFRERQKLAGPGGGEGEELEGVEGGEGGVLAGGGGGEWSVGRKRKRRKDDHGDGVLKGLLKRRESGNTGGDGGKEKGEEGKRAEGTTTRTTSAAAGKEVKTAGQEVKTASTATAAITAPPPAKPRACLVDYGSDDDSD